MFRRGQEPLAPASLQATFMTWEDALDLLDPAQSYLNGTPELYKYLGKILMGRAAFERISEAGAINSWDLLKSRATRYYGLDSMQTEKLFMNMHMQSDENAEDFILRVDRAYC